MSNKTDVKEKQNLRQAGTIPNGFAGCLKCYFEKGLTIGCQCGSPAGDGSEKSSGSKKSGGSIKEINSKNNMNLNALPADSVTANSDTQTAAELATEYEEIQPVDLVKQSQEEVEEIKDNNTSELEGKNFATTSFFGKSSLGFKRNSFSTTSASHGKEEDNKEERKSFYPTPFSTSPKLPGWKR